MTRVPFVRSRPRRNLVITFWIGSSGLGVQSPSLSFSLFLSLSLTLCFSSSFSPSLSLWSPGSPGFAFFLFFSYFSFLFFLSVSSATFLPAFPPVSIITDYEFRDSQWLAILSEASHLSSAEPLLNSERSAFVVPARVFRFSRFQLRCHLPNL